MEAEKPRIPNAVLGCILILLGCVFAGLVIRGLAEEIRLRRWVEVPCRITRSDVCEVAGTTTRHRFEVRYVYSWNGKQYEGSTYSLSYSPTPERKYADDLRDRFPIGHTTTCYVNPDSPETQAVLERGSLLVGFSILLALVPIVLGVRRFSLALQPPRRPALLFGPLTTTRKSRPGRTRWGRIWTWAWRGLVAFALFALAATFLKDFWAAFSMVTLIGVFFLLLPYLASAAAVSVYREIRKHLRDSLPEQQAETVGTAERFRRRAPKDRVLTPMEKAVVAIAAVLYIAFITYQIMQSWEKMEFWFDYIRGALFMAVWWLMFWVSCVFAAIVATRSFRARRQRTHKPAPDGVPKPVRIAKRIAMGLFLACWVTAFVGVTVLLGVAHLLPMDTWPGVRFPLAGMEDIAVDSTGTIYCETGFIQRIQAYSAAGEFEWGRFIPTSGPMRLKTDTDDRLHVIAVHGNDHYVFDGEGRLVSAEKIPPSNEKKLRAGKTIGEDKDAQGNRYEVRGLSPLNPRVVRILPDNSSQSVVSDSWYMRPMSFAVLWVVLMISMVVYAILNLVPSRAEKAPEASAPGSPSV